jgi:hypothetical protein
MVEFVPDGSIPLGSAKAQHAPPILNNSRFSISPFVNREWTLHNPQAFRA